MIYCKIHRKTCSSLFPEVNVTSPSSQAIKQKLLLCRNSPTQSTAKNSVSALSIKTDPPLDNNLFYNRRDWTKKFSAKAKGYKTLSHRERILQVFQLFFPESILRIIEKRHKHSKSRLASHLEDEHYNHHSQRTYWVQVERSWGLSFIQNQEVIKGGIGAGTFYAWNSIGNNSVIHGNSIKKKKKSSRRKKEVALCVAMFCLDSIWPIILTKGHFS